MAATYSIISMFRGETHNYNYQYTVVCHESAPARERLPGECQHESAEYGKPNIHNTKFNVESNF